MAFSASPFDPQYFPMIKLDLKKYWHHIPDECGAKRFVRIPTLPNKEQREEYKEMLEQQSIANLTILREQMQQINNNAKNPLDTYSSHASIQLINETLKAKGTQKPPVHPVVIRHNMIPWPCVRILYPVPAGAVQTTAANEGYRSVMKSLDQS
jgi:hypothetical protein